MKSRKHRLQKEEHEITFLKIFRDKTGLVVWVHPALDNLCFGEAGKCSEEMNRILDFVNDGLSADLEVRNLCSSPPIKHPLKT